MRNETASHERDQPSADASLRHGHRKQVVPNEGSSTDTSRRNMRLLKQYHIRVATSDLESS